MTAVHDVQAAAQPAQAATEQPSLWHRPAIYRYGFLAVILIVWEVVGPSINPIFFTYPSRIAIAFYGLLMSGELWYCLQQSLEVLVLGLGVAIAIGIPLGVSMARMRRLRAGISRVDGAARYRVVDSFTTGQIKDAQSSYTLTLVDANRIEMRLDQGSTIKLQRCK